MFKRIAHLGREILQYDNRSVLKLNLVKRYILERLEREAVTDKTRTWEEKGKI